jgi:hypothetical protein
MKNIQVFALALGVVVAGGVFAVSPALAGGTKKETAAEPAVTREVYGKIQSVKGTMVTIQTRTGATVRVETKPAIEADRNVTPIVGHAINVKGTMDKAGVMHADTVQKAKDSPAIWPADR